MKLWVFGHSSCLPFNLDDGQGWVEQLAQSLDIPYENFAEAAADNLFIYHTVMSNLDRIRSTDIVVVGWSHPNRKSFVLDRDNPNHTRALKDGSMVFDGSTEFFRSVGTVADTKQKWSKMIPIPNGNKFFDQWFENYHNEYECRLNLKAYIHSVDQSLPCKNIKFYFSRESVDHPTDQDFYWLDFIINSGLWISKDNMHPNQQGHDEMAKIFLKTLTTL